MNSGATLHERDGLESARGHCNRDPKLAAVDFGSEKRPRDGYRALPLEPPETKARCVTARSY